jgi:HSP20 family molecular chaperone IbpA
VVYSKEPTKIEEYSVVANANMNGLSNILASQLKLEQGNYEIAVEIPPASAKGLGVHTTKDGFLEISITNQQERINEGNWIEIFGGVSKKFLIPSDANHRGMKYALDSNTNILHVRLPQRTQDSSSSSQVN